MNNSLKILANAFKDKLVIASIVIGIPLGLIILFGYLRLFHLSPESAWINILVEAHGLIFDIIFFSIIMAIYANLQERKNRITRYKEELDDYRGWDDKEAAYRVAGIIRRLEREGVNDIDLNDLHFGNCTEKTIKKAIQENARLIGLPRYLCYQNLTGANLRAIELSNTEFEQSLLNGVILLGATLNYCTFQEVWLNDANLEASKMTNAVLDRVDLKKANLRRADFSGATLNSVNLEEAELIDTIFIKASMRHIKLSGARVDSPHWIKKLRKWDVAGIDWIESNFHVDPTPVNSNPFSRQEFIIREKPQNQVSKKTKCISSTKSGQPCKRKPKPGYDKCTLHLKLEEDTDTVTGD